MSILINNKNIKNICVKTNENLKQIKKGYIKTNNTLKIFYDNSNEEQEQGLPDEYQLVEYIYNNSLSYISTELYGAYTYEIKFKITDSTSSASQKTPLFLYYNNNNRNGFTYSSSTPYLFYLSERFDLKKEIGDILNKEITLLYNISPNHSFEIKINNNTYSYQSTIQSEIDYFNNMELVLFARNNNPSITANGGVYIYYCKFYSDTSRNNLIADFIPCKRKSDSKPGMYNLIKRQFYFNSGSETYGSLQGGLVAGPEINS